ncbi:uncharacterized protein HMPREF1541_04559 [Cyphellophora europaea CBS 101466]|uniref:Rhodanese domain-containing protein n=1 Tax=Cyphellophora europaea (strain CBS 101466) TaxID=1220924 RepID=W2RWX1_CYPE1|nr:uncharacterized protein HMPREF1541_04559 [Cyphellophora europaea CBS 101466]ETN40283.1 hypothetical protein HMPREF1541_04559 [Cyphellophora europaea CBS 101466]
MRRPLRATALFLCYLGLGLAADQGQEKQPFSQRMLASIIGRQQGVVSSGETTSTLESGFLALTLLSTADRYAEQASTYTGYLNRILDIASAELDNATADALLPLDRLSVGVALSDAAKPLGGLSKNQTAAATALAASLRAQARNYLGGYLYYAGAYPTLSYLDGLFSLLPYTVAQPSPNYTDISLQLSLLVSRCHQESSGLVTHGYDANFTYPWAERPTGKSPYVWGRSLGWFMSGLVQAYGELCCASASRAAREELGPAETQLCDQLKTTFQDTARNLIPYADQSTGAWYQLTALPGETGNFLESSSTLLFTWSLLKAIRLQILADMDFESTVHEASMKAYRYAAENFLVYYNMDGSFAESGGGNGTVGINQTVAVCSLNSTATYEYYTGRPILLNSLLGESAFVMASLEVERLGERWGG